MADAATRRDSTDRRSDQNVAPGRCARRGQSQAGCGRTEVPRGTVSPAPRPGTCVVPYSPRRVRSSKRPLLVSDLPRPEPASGQVLLKVRACGVCRTDLHIVEGELAPLHDRMTPGHQIVGEIVAGDLTPGLSLGMRVGVSWLGGTDGTCPYCVRGAENLCDSPTFTGYSVNGGFSRQTVARADFIHPLPDALSDLEAAPLLCAGII